MNRYKNESEISIPELIALLISKIGWIVGCTVLVAALALGVAVVKGRNTEVVVPTQEQIEAARNMLSPSDADNVDRVYEQYLSYTGYKKSLQQYFSEYLMTDDDADSYMREYVLYSMSSNVYDADRVFTYFVLTPEVYKEIESVLPGDESLGDIYNRVWISAGEQESLVLLNDDGNGSFRPNDYMLTVNIIAKSEEQCKQIEAIIDKSIHEQLTKLQKIDENATLTFFGSTISEDMHQWIVDRHNEAISQLNSVENALKNFNNNQVNNLSSEQKKYYDLLVSAGEDQPLTVKSSSKKKPVIIGAIGGFVIACGWIVLQYLFSNRIKTKNEIMSRYDIPVLESVAVQGKKNLLFDGLIRKLREIPDTDMETSVRMAALDIDILMKKNHADSVFFVKTANTDEEKDVTDNIMRKLSEMDVDYTILSGNPADDPDDLRKMSDAKNVVLVAEIEKTRMSVADKYYELFDICGSNILGSVIVR